MMSSWTQFLAARGASIEDDTVVRFSSSTDELAAARDAAIVCDLTPLATIGISGADAATFLQGQFTNDIEALSAGSAQYSAWCSPKGRILANFLLLRTGDATFEMLLPSSLSVAIRKRLSMFVLRSKVVIEDTSGERVRVGIAGPASATALRAAAVDAPPLFRWRAIDGGLIVSVPGGRYIALVHEGAAKSLWASLSEAARPVGFAVWQWLTVRAGIPVITAATTDQLVPQMANWDALEGVSFRKGCYTGQEIVARTQYLGRLKERTYLAHIETSPPAAGDKLYSVAFGEQSCGVVLNAAAAPGGGSDLVAALQIAAAQSGDVRIGSPQGMTLDLLTLPYPVPGGGTAPAAEGPSRGRTA